METATEDKLESARSQAKAQLESIVSLMQRLDHCQECTGEDCELSDVEILDGLGYVGEVGEDMRETYHDEDAAQTAIDESPLSVEVRSGWHSQGESAEEAQYRICLCTGGPAVQIVGELGAFNQPDTAQLQCQDWFTPWTDVDTTSEDEATMLAYAQHFVIS